MSGKLIEQAGGEKQRQLVSKANRLPVVAFLSPYSLFLCNNSREKEGGVKLSAGLSLANHSNASHGIKKRGKEPGCGFDLS